MEYKPIITSPIDNDLYKFTMMQAVYHQFPTAKVKYKFKCRSNVTLDEATKNHITKGVKSEIQNLKRLKFEDAHAHILDKTGLFTADFLGFLVGRSVMEKSADIYIQSSDTLFDLNYNGLWLDTILPEVPLLSATSEIGLEKINAPFRPANFDNILKTAIKKRLDFAITHPNFRFADFGTRRRYSKAHQEASINAFVEAKKNHQTNALVGTSNVFFAALYDLLPVGTQAHEWFQAMQAMTNLTNFQKFALQAWANEYRGNLGIALSDCMGMEQFLKDFDMYFAKLFDGCRHDSGCPHKWMNSLLAHYEKFKIDAKTKTAIFSDGLNFETGAKLQEQYSDKINVGLGIGTYFTNNVSDSIQPLSIVIKMTKCNGQPVAKLSDSPGKEMCEDNNYVQVLKRLFNK